MTGTSEPSTVWVVRAGRDGENEQWCIDTSRAGAAWNVVPPLDAATSRSDVRRLVQSAFPTEPQGRVSNWAGQLWAVRSIAVGDLIVMPMKTTKSIAIGRCISPYAYDAAAPIGHAVGVEWLREDIARSAIEQDLLYTLGAIMTVFKASRNEARERFEAVLVNGVDPGPSVPPGDAAPTTPAGTPDASSEAPTDPVAVPTMETIRDRIRAYVAEHFREHRLTHLVAEVLRARGFYCDVSPPGKDQGVDILCGSGPLGLDSPTLIVEVKSEPTAIGAPVVRGLQGAMLSHRSDQGLLVAWGGITKDARNEIRKDRLMMRVWDADDLLDQVFETYEHLSEEARLRLPLKRSWVLDEETSQ